MVRRLAAATVLSLVLAAGAARAAEEGFALRDSPGDHLDVLFAGRPVARYMYAFDTSTPARAHETYKPYLHVFDADGTTLLTKGPGGLYTHHRGVFIGWQKIRFEGKAYNLWEMADGALVHEKFLEERATPDEARFTSLVHWRLKDGRTILDEERTMALHRPAAAGEIALVDFRTALKAVAGDLVLDGDPEHGGVQYRPADAVDKKETKYLFPKDGADPRKDKDLPWAAESYVLGGKRYSVQHMNGPDNPKDTLYSAYRDYGRFGAFFRRDLQKGETLHLAYRIRVTAGDLPPREELQRQYDAFVAAGGK